MKKFLVTRLLASLLIYLLMSKLGQMRFNKKIIGIYRVSMFPSGKATSLFIYFTYVLAYVQARTEV